MINCCIYFIQQVTCVFQKNCSSFALFYSLGGCFFILQSFPYMTYFRRLTCTELIGLSLAESEDLKRDELNTKITNPCNLTDTPRALYSMKRIIKGSCQWHDLRSFNNFLHKGTTFFIFFKQSPRAVLLKRLLQICNTFFEEHIGETASE